MLESHSSVRWDTELLRNVKLKTSLPFKFESIARQRMPWLEMQCGAFAMLWNSKLGWVVVCLFVLLCVCLFVCFNTRLLFSTLTCFSQDCGNCAESQLDEIV